MKQNKRAAQFGAHWRDRHPRRRVPIPEDLLRRLVPIAEDMVRCGFGWDLRSAMWELQRALAEPDADTRYILRWGFPSP